MDNLPEKYHPDTDDSFLPVNLPGMPISTYLSCVARGTLAAIWDTAKEYLLTSLENRVKAATVATALTLASAAGVPALYNAITAPASKALVAATATTVAYMGQTAVIDEFVLDAIDFPCDKSLFPPIDPNEVFGIDQLLKSPKTYTLPDIKPRI
ncbi:MAG: hypothetical protein AABX47_04370 [Nanoarchaeota archaeon]